MAELQYANGSWFVVYAGGNVERCHNRATAEYLVRAHNAGLTDLCETVACAIPTVSFTATFNDPVPA